MGCCPSKHKAGKSAEFANYSEYPPTEKIDIAFTLSERPTSATLPVYEDVAAAAAAKAHEAPSTMLMDRGDGCAIERSDHESDNNDGEVAIAITMEEEDNQFDHETVRPAEKTAGPMMTAAETPAFPPIDMIHDPRDASSTSAHGVPSATGAASPARSPIPTSPPKTPINFEDMPINSMYHRIHVVEVEEMEAKRRQEQREEAERREREIQEFKAAMLASNE